MPLLTSEQEETERYGWFLLDGSYSVSASGWLSDESGDTVKRRRAVLS